MGKNHARPRERNEMQAAACTRQIDPRTGTPQERAAAGRGGGSVRRRSRPASAVLAVLGSLLVGVIELAGPTTLRAQPETAPPTPMLEDPSAAVPGVARRLVASEEEPILQDLLRRVLDYHPALAAAQARAEAAVQEAPQARALPDPSAMVTAFVSSPETRVGPQRLAVTLSQQLPWLSKLDDREARALWRALSLRAEAEALRLAKITEARRLYWEIAFLDELAEIQQQKRDHLLQHEEAARARYATGVGESQGVIKLQAEITRTEAELVDIATRRAGRLAQLAALAGGRLAWPAEHRLPGLKGARGDAGDGVGGGAPDATWLAPGALVPLAQRHRPEMVATEAAAEGAAVGRQLARKERLPDFTVGLTWTLVEPRSDLPGLTNPPNRNGEDVLGLQGGVRVPLWRERLDAAVAQAAALENAATAARRDTLLTIERQLDDLTARFPLIERRLELFEEILLLQAEEALASAEAGYIAGRMTALDLLDAEHVLFDARAAAARARADRRIVLAELEGAVGLPLSMWAETLEAGVPEDSIESRNKCLTPGGELLLEGRNKCLAPGEGPAATEEVAR